jgi:hypothetical protein
LKGGQIPALIPDVAPGNDAVGVQKAHGGLGKYALTRA